MKQEIKDYYKCDEHVVIQSSSYIISLLNVISGREFSICSLETKKNLKSIEIQEIFACLQEFLTNVSEKSPCYVAIDVSKTDAFTISQLQHAANIFKKMKPYLETRLVGSIVKICDENHNDSFLTKAFHRLYTPIRPVLWWRKDGEAVNFIREWESKL